MNYEIIEIITDSAGKYRVRVVIDENTSQFFKFNHNPSQEEVNYEVKLYLNNQINIGVIE